MLRQASILVIDDEPNLRNTLSVILQRGGYQVTTAANGAEALQRLKNGIFDMAFLDLKLPDTSGLELLPNIRGIYPDMPILILTAHATLNSAIEAVRKGARDYMLKPINPKYILERVKEMLAEQEKPLRQREIISQVQGLLSELRADGNKTNPSQNPTTSPAELDPDRYLQSGDLIIDLHTRHILFESRSIPLPPSSFDFLVTLARHSPEPVSYEGLVKESQGYDLSRFEAREIARWQIHKIRKALEPDSSNPHFIITVRNFGYRLVV